MCHANAYYARRRTLSSAREHAYNKTGLASYEPKNGTQKPAGPTQSPGPLGCGCRFAHPEKATATVTHSAARNT